VFVLLALFLLAPPSTFALNVDYPAIPIPGGKLDLNCIERIGTAEYCSRSSIQLEPRIGTVILLLYSAALWIGGIIAFVALIYTGFTFVLSGQSPDMRERAKNRMQNVAWGIGILLLSVIALRLINPDITTLRDPTLGIERAEAPGDISFGDPAVPGPPAGRDPIGISQPAPPAPGTPGTFSCGNTSPPAFRCGVITDNCNTAEGYVPDLGRCKDLGQEQCPRSRNLLCIQRPANTFSCALVLGPPVNRCGVEENNNCADGYMPDQEKCKDLGRDRCVATKDLPCIQRPPNTFSCVVTGTALNRRCTVEENNNCADWRVPDPEKCAALSVAECHDVAFQNFQCIQR
jgi:hypothetical protein